MEIKTLGKGCLIDTPDERDFKFEDLVFGATKVDWNIEFRLPEPPNENQNGSLSCVSQACSYYHWQLRGKDYSRRDLYSEIALPGGGAELRSGVKRIVDYGQATRDEVPDPSPQTEVAMTNHSGVTREKQASDKEFAYAVVKDRSIDGVALAIQQNLGVIFGVIGNNTGWTDLDNPTPPAGSVPIDFQNRPELWGHAIYGMGYHMHNGQKCIIAKSSWCNDKHHEHHIKEDYFKSGWTFNAWTLVPLKGIMYTTKKVKINKQSQAAVLGVLIDTPNGIQVIKAIDEAMWRSWAVSSSYQIHTVNDDGSTDWTVDLEINL